MSAAGDHARGVEGAKLVARADEAGRECDGNDDLREQARRTLRRDATEGRKASAGGSDISGQSCA